MSMRRSAAASAVAILIVVLATSGCIGPLTPGHRDFEGDIWVMKLDDAGKQEWFRVIDSGDFDEAFAIVETPYGGYAIAGSRSILITGSNSDTQPSRHIPGIILLDSEGAVLKIAENESAAALDISPGINGTILQEMAASNTTIPTQDGGPVSITLSKNTFRDADLRVEKLDRSGNTVWAVQHHLDEYSRLVGIIQASDGGFAVLGMYLKF